MTKTLQDVLKQAENWPEEAQDELLDAALDCYHFGSRSRAPLLRVLSKG